MADPVTVGLLVAGLAVSAAGAVSSGVQAAKTQRFNASLAQREADIQSSIAAQRGEDMRRAGRRRAGAIRAAAGEQGFDPGVGSVADILADEARETEFAARIAEFGGELAQFGAKAEARVRNFQAGAAIQGGFFRAGATILGGAFRAKRAGFFG